MNETSHETDGAPQPAASSGEQLARELSEIIDDHEPAEPLANPEDFYKASLAAAAGIEDSRPSAFGHYTEVHVSNGTVIVAPNPVDSNRHAAQINGTHSMFEVFAADPQAFSDIAPLVDFAASHHLNQDTYAARAALVHERDTDETVLRLYNVSRSYEGAAGEKNKGYTWLDDLMAEATVLGIDRVEQVIDTGERNERITLDPDQTQLRTDLHTLMPRIDNDQKPRTYLPSGTTVGTITNANLETTWIARPRTAGQRADATKPPLHRVIRSSLDVAEADADRHQGLNAALKRDGLKDAPDSAVTVTWQGEPLGINGNFSTDTRSDRLMASVNLMLTSERPLAELHEAIEALGIPLAEAAREALSKRRVEKMVDGIHTNEPANNSNCELNFFVAVTNLAGGRPQTLRRVGSLGDIVADPASTYSSVGAKQFQAFLEPEARP